MGISRRIAHVDMDAFFAAVEQLRRPELRGRPVIVGGRGDPSERGVVSTASYEARAHGVHSATPLRTAARLCPDGVFLPVDFAAYRPVSQRFKAALSEFSDTLQDMGIDEAYLDVSAVPLESVALGRTIKERVVEATGITCSVGIAPNKLLAKLASDLEKPDGLTVLGYGDIETRIWPLAVRKLRGVGAKTERLLRGLGIHTIGELAAHPREALCERLGTNHAEYLLRAACGIDLSPLTTRWEPKSHSREKTFQRDVRDRAVLETELDEIAVGVAGDLQKRGYAGRNVTVKLRYANFTTQTRGLTLPSPIDDWTAIRLAARHCFERFALDRSVRLLGVRVGALERVERAPG